MKEFDKRQHLSGITCTLPGITWISFKSQQIKYRSTCMYINIYSFRTRNFYFHFHSYQNSMRNFYLHLDFKSTTTSMLKLGYFRRRPMDWVIFIYTNKKRNHKHITCYTICIFKILWHHYKQKIERSLYLPPFSENVCQY